MKLKVIDNITWQRFPETNDMVDIDITTEQLYQIGNTLQFDIENNFKLIPYTNPTILLENKLKRLEELSKDFAQVQAGLFIEDIEERKLEFQTILNEVRVLQGKEPRNIL